MYRGEMEEVTSSFAQLSQDMITHVMWFRENGQTESAGILDNLQQNEKEKLQLVIFLHAHTNIIGKKCGDLVVVL